MGYKNEPDPGAGQVSLVKGALQGISSSVGINLDNSIDLQVLISITCRQLSRQKDVRVKVSEQKYLLFFFLNFIS